MPLRFNSLLRGEGIDPAEVRLIRHQTRKAGGRTPYTLWRDDPAGFEVYQGIQSNKPREVSKFRGKYWASFVAPPDGSTMFVGLYKVEWGGPMLAGMIDPLTGAEIVGDMAEYRYEKQVALGDYVGRIHIHWGDTPNSKRAWVQRADNQDKLILKLSGRLPDPLGAAVEEEVARALRVSKAIRPATELYFVGETDGPKYLYILRLEGDVAAWLGRSAVDVAGKSIIKVGFSKNPASRRDQIQAAYPVGKFQWRVLFPKPPIGEPPYKNADVAIAGEDAMKEYLGKDLRQRLGGEFFVADDAEIERAWAFGAAASEAAQGG